MDQQRTEIIWVVCQALITAWDWTVWTRRSDGTFPWHAHVYHLSFATNRHESSGSPAGSGPVAWKGKYSHFLFSQIPIEQYIFCDFQEKRDLVTGLKSRTIAGRPNWNKVFTQIREQRKGRVTVFYCGNPILAKIVRKKCNEFKFIFRKEVFWIKR